ncbi:hypothetical protein BC832DRAFT_615130 [Gaertneriomyces semiglobifer]|nr:hypothetical protein BC832DRAFT_615130 [Gaertneriomyces semiglobifer]
MRIRSALAGLLLATSLVGSTFAAPGDTGEGCDNSECTENTDVCVDNICRRLPGQICPGTGDTYGTPDDCFSMGMGTCTEGVLYPGSNCVIRATMSAMINIFVAHSVTCQYWEGYVRITLNAKENARKIWTGEIRCQENMDWGNPMPGLNRVCGLKTRAAFDQPCAINDDCTSGLCSKANPADSTGTCKARLGGTCDVDEECAGANRKCKDVDPNDPTAGTKCGLATPATGAEPCAFHSDCASGELFGGECGSDQDCVDDYAQCKDVDPLDFSAGRVCGLGTQVGTGGECAVDDDCISDAGCHRTDPGDLTGTCKSPLGGECYADEECANLDAECKDIGSTGTNAGRCGIATPGAPGDACAFATDCESTICGKVTPPDATGICQSPLGGTCTGDEACEGADLGGGTGGYAICKNVDPNDANSNKVCGLATEAIDGAPCALNSDCMSHVCIKDDLTDFLGSCKAQLGGTCGIDGDCADAAAECKNVDPNDANSNMVCGLATEAADGEQCAVHSDCESSTCTKGDPTDPTGICRAPLGWTCEVDGDCADATAECKSVNPNGVTAGKVCGLAIEAADGEQCALHSDCESSTCTKGNPTDPTGICKAPLGWRCDIDEDCADSTAECKSVNPNDLDAGKVCGHAIAVSDGLECAVDSDCSGTGSTCRITAPESTGVCTPPRGAHGQRCATGTPKCNGSTLECKNDICVRKAGNRVPVGSDCAIRSDCSEGSCIKADPTAALGKCVKLIGQSCSGDHCSTDLTCRATTPRVCVRSTAKTVPLFGACAITGDCVDVSAGKPAFCEKANATRSMAGQCVELRGLGVECSVAGDCMSKVCSGEPKKCGLSTSGFLSAQEITLPAVSVVADEPNTVTVPGGVNVQLTPSIGGDVQVAARGEKQETQPAPPGTGVGLFLTIDLPANAAVLEASINFEYLAEHQAANNDIPGDQLTWNTFDEIKKQWVSCDAESTGWDADTRTVSCKTEHFSDWTISTKVSAAFAAYMPQLLTVVAATALSLSMVF